jgi:hypothetical protein
MNLPASFVILVLLVLHAGAATLYVDVNSPNPTPPYADLTTAAVAIQDAVDAADNGDLILVNDGYYQDGFRATSSGSLGNKTVQTNRVVIAKSLTVQSLNGPTATYISGSGLYRCVCLTNGATLSGFTLTGGAAGYIETITLAGHTTTKTIAGDGGAVSGATVGGGTVSNCVLTANTATEYGGGAYTVTLINCLLTGNFAILGGGASACTLINCDVTGNSTPTTGVNGPADPEPNSGGGIYAGSAINCVIAQNSAWQGGGCAGGRLVNCTIVNNSAGFGGGISYATDASVNNCILYDNTAGTNDNFGAGNLAIDYCCTYPLPAGGAGNLTNDPVFMDVWGGDYHLQSTSPCINAGLNAAIANSADLDGNPRIVGGTVDLGAYEFQESDAPALLITSILPVTGSNQVIITWQSVNNWNYSIQRSCDLTEQPAFITLQDNFVGQADTTSFTDTTATNNGPYFYQVVAQ